MNRVTRLFQPLVVVPKNAVVKKNEVTSRSQKVGKSICDFIFSLQNNSFHPFPQLMTEMGLIHSANNGTYHLLPVLQRSIEKLTAIVDEEMARIGGQKMSLPILTSVDLWNQTGRLKDIGREVMSCIDRHNHTQILSPVDKYCSEQAGAYSIIHVYILFPDQRRKYHSSDGPAISDLVQTIAYSIVSGEWVGCLSEPLHTQSYPLALSDWRQIPGRNETPLRINPSEGVCYEGHVHV